VLNRNYFTNHDIHRLEEKAVEMRQDILDMIYRAGAGHPGGSLSAVEVITALYFHVMKLVALLRYKLILYSF